MKKFDSEDLLDSVLQIMTDGLNAKITAIEAEKTAAGKVLSPGLKLVADGSYYQQTWTSKILQTNPAIFYGIEDVNTVDGGGPVAKTYNVFVEVCMVDNGMQNDTHKRIARYARALEETFADAFFAAAEVGKVKIGSVRPMSWKLELDSDEEIKVGGISLTITLI